MTSEVYSFVVDPTKKIFPSFNVKYNFENDKLNITIPNHRTFLQLDNCLDNEFINDLKSYGCSSSQVLKIEKKLQRELSKLHQQQ